MRKSLLLVVVACAVVLCAANLARASDIYSCVHRTNGNVRIVNSPSQCHETEYALVWDSGQDFDQAINALVGRVQALEEFFGVLNEAPFVDIGMDRITTVSLGLDLNASVGDDGILHPLILTWSVESGPGEVVFSDASGLSTHASFSAPGSYELVLSADDGLVVVSDSLMATVYANNDPPSIDLGGSQSITASYEMGIYYCQFTWEPVAIDDGPLSLSYEWDSAYDSYAQWTVGDQGNTRPWEENCFTYFDVAESSLYSANHTVTFIFQLGPFYNSSECRPVTLDLELHVTDGIYEEHPSAHMRCWIPE